MALFDVNNPPAAPDSDLDSDTSLEQSFTLQGGTSDNQPIAPGDWVDVDPGCGLDLDPNWGSSYQVANLYWNENPNLQQVGILYSPDQGASYYEQTIDTKAWISNNFRHVPRTGE